ASLRSAPTCSSPWGSPASGSVLGSGSGCGAVWVGAASGCEAEGAACPVAADNVPEVDSVVSESDSEGFGLFGLVVFILDQFLFGRGERADALSLLVIGGGGGGIRLVEPAAGAVLESQPVQVVATARRARQ